MCIRDSDCKYDFATTPYHGEQTFQIEGVFNLINNLKSDDPKIDLEVDWKTGACHITGKWEATLQRILELPWLYIYPDDFFT